MSRLWDSVRFRVDQELLGFDEPVEPRVAKETVVRGTQWYESVPQAGCRPSEIGADLVETQACIGAGGMASLYILHDKRGRLVGPDKAEVLAVKGVSSILVECLVASVPKHSCTADKGISLTGRSTDHDPWLGLGVPAQGPRNSLGNQCSRSFAEGSPPSLERCRSGLCRTMFEEQLLRVKAVLATEIAVVRIGDLSRGKLPEKAAQA